MTMIKVTKTEFLSTCGEHCVDPQLVVDDLIADYVGSRDLSQPEKVGTIKSLIFLKNIAMIDIEEKTFSDYLANRY